MKKAFRFFGSGLFGYLFGVFTAELVNLAKTDKSVPCFTPLPILARHFHPFRRKTARSHPFISAAYAANRYFCRAFGETKPHRVRLSPLLGRPVGLF